MNIAGLALIGLAVVLFIVDIYAPTHGVLTAGGIVSFFLGALMLFNRAGPGVPPLAGLHHSGDGGDRGVFHLRRGRGLARAVPAGARRPETMLGKTVPALARIDAGGGKVFVEGEYWNAVSDVAGRAGPTGGNRRPSKA